MTKRKVFVCHSWEDNEISRKLAEYLNREGADIWIDYTKIYGGDSLPRRISEALEWCDTLILLWSKSAQYSYYVNLEWENALDLRKKIIPCLLDTTKRPAILSRYRFIDFKNFDDGYRQLACALDLIKLKNFFRSEPATLTDSDVKAILNKFDFFDLAKNSFGLGYANQYKVESIKGDKVVVDETCGLMWQQGGSSEAMFFDETKDWLKKLNFYSYAGYYDWRLPTLEEAMSLMEPERKNGVLFIDLKFDRTQQQIWTSDHYNAELRVWIVYFGLGFCGDASFNDDSYVRAVRSG